MNNDDSRSILFVGGGQETIPGVEIAKAMGLCVIVSDMSAEAPCVKLADHFLLADTYSVSDTLREVESFCEKYRSIDGVMCMATDVPLTVAIVAQELGLAGIPVEAAKIVSDKMLMKDCFKASYLPIPWYSEVSDAENLKQIVRDRGQPLIIKPVDSRGARGVLKLMEDVDLEWAYLTSLSYSPSSRVMVEEFLSGPQVSTESLIVEGKVYTIGFSDRNYELLDKYAPHIIEDGGDLPSALLPADQKRIKDTVAQTASVLKITNGVIKGDMVLSGGDPYIIEVATRLSGGYFCSHEIPLNTGVDFVRIAIQMAMGESISEDSLLVSKDLAVCQRYFFPEPGVVQKIIIPEWINTHSDVNLCEIRVSVGDVIAEATHHPSRAGLVITSGKNRAEALNLARKVVRDIHIVTQ